MREVRVFDLYTCSFDPGGIFATATSSSRRFVSYISFSLPSKLRRKAHNETHIFQIAARLDEEIGSKFRVQKAQDDAICIGQEPEGENLFADGCCAGRVEREAP